MHVPILASHQGDTEVALSAAEELTLADAARALGLSRQRLAILAKEGRLGRQVAGRYWVFTPAEIAAYKPHVKASKGGRPKAGTRPLPPAPPAPEQEQP